MSCRSADVRMFMQNNTGGAFEQRCVHMPDCQDIFRANVSWNNHFVLQIMIKMPSLASLKPPGVFLKEFIVREGFGFIALWKMFI